MKRLTSSLLLLCACLFVHAELKVQYTFENCNSSVGMHTGTLHNGAKLTTIDGLPALSLGADNGYFDMGTSVGEVIGILEEYVITTNVYIPNTTTLGGAGNFIFTFANSTDIAGNANGCIFLGANGMRYAISPRRWEDEQAIEAGSQFPKGQWHTLTYVQDGSSASLYLDQRLVADGRSLMTPSKIGATPYNFLGRPCYVGDAYLKDAAYNDFRIYDSASDINIEEFTKNLDRLNRGMEEWQVTELMNEITLGGDRFYDDIVLPTPNKNGVTVTWTSSDESTISPTGRVTRPAYGSGTACVTLTATFSKGSISLQKEFVVYVPSNDMSDADIVDGDMMNLTINGHLENLTTNLYLPTRGKKGSDISWQSSRPDILSHEGELLSQPQSKTSITLTATISLRNAVATKTFHITAAKKLPLAYYLFAYFNGNAQWQEQICFALSTDGYNYTPLNNGDPIINSADIALKQAVRDPHILRGEDGYFYMVVTDMRSSDGWSSNDGMVLLRSADMINWTHTAIDFPTRWPERFDRNKLTQVWAPQTIYDPEEGKYMVYYAIGESGKNYITYYSYANEDFTDLTEPQVLYNHGGMNTIDADIVWHDGKYHMFFKTEGQGNGIQKATAKTLRGEWTPEYQYLQQTSAAVEGSGVFKKIDSDEWVLMYDCYTSGMYEYCTSTDLSNFTKVCNSANTSIFTPRHGTTIAITAAEAERLVEVWPSEGLDIANWIDLTDYFIESPRFDNNSSVGWTVESNAHSQNKSYNTMEFWNGTFNIYQTINVPNGKYRLSVQSFYSPAYEGSDMGYLYANQVRQPLVNRTSEGVTSNYNPGGWDRVTINGSRRYIPNNMEAANYCFEQGMYNNSLEVEVTDGTLTLGLICENVSGANWCQFDNFKLELFGRLVLIEGITLSRTSLSLNDGESATLQATVMPSNATIQNIDWYSSNPSIADVDEHGNVTAYQKGVTTIYAQSVDGSDITASCRVLVKGTTPTAENIVINEVQACNIDMYVDPSYNYGGWIELYNPTDQSVSLNNLYISDDAENPTKHNLGRDRGAIPAKGYRVLWFDHYNFHYAPSQIDFKLDYDGGTIYLSDAEGNIITSFDYPVAVPRTSYARTTDNGSEWNYTAFPTPGANNATSIFAEERLEAPIVDKDACLFTAPFTFNVEIPEGTTLYYTTDGSTPSLTNGNISEDGVFYVDNTATYRFALFQEGMLPSQVVTRSYIYSDKDYNLPIISVVTDPINLYDDMLGVYVRGTNGRTGNGESKPCNWNMDWDRPVNFEYITPEGGMVINQEVDFAMCGGWSRSWNINPVHSFKLKAGKIYEGLNSIDYPFFTDKPYLKHKTLQIRNGGNDAGSRIKDLALQEIVLRSGLDIEGQSSQPVHHFINGEYMGMLNMREPNNKHYAYANWGIDTDEMDQFEMSPDSGYVQMEGTREAFLEWYALSENAEDEDIYEEIRNLVDIDEYINYMAVELYLGGTDWPQNNIKGFRPRIENGRFRFVLFDLDGTLSTTSPFYTFENKQTHTFDYIYDMGDRFTEEIELVTIFLNMLQNDSFRKQFIDTYCLVAGSVFEPQRCNAIIDEMAELRAAALSLEGRSPYGTANNLKSALANRQGTLINALIEYDRLNLNQEMKQSATITTNVDNAVLLLNEMPIPTSKFNGSIFAPITLKAEPKAGYRFAGWSDVKAVGQGTTLIARGSSWKYYDQGSLDGKDWNNTSYSTTSWEEGNAPLGYFTSDATNSRGYNTTLDYGTDGNNKRPTYYFRSSFRVTKTPTSEDIFKLNYTVDDGMIVYVNGVEAARYLMPSGTISYSTYSSAYANDNPDQGSLILDASLFKRGTNTIAIEVHNCDNKSSDIYFDIELTHTSAQAVIVCEDAEYTLPNSGNFSLTAIYEPLSDTELTETKSLPIRINEISADNSIYVNEYYKKNDWIELFNTTSEPIDVAGMYLSDNLNKPTKFQIARNEGINTIVEPYSYLVIWADKLTNLSQLHAPFKLAAEGGYIMLTSEDKTWSDALYYEPHLGTESVGLYPDGSNEVYVMNTPTIAKANTINSYATWLEQPEIDTNIETEFAEEDKMRLVYREQMLHIHSMDGTWANITIYATTGKIHTRATVKLIDGYAVVSTSTLSHGIYIASVTDSNGNTQTIKLKAE